MRQVEPVRAIITSARRRLVAPTLGALGPFFFFFFFCLGRAVKRALQTEGVAVSRSFGNASVMLRAYGEPLSCRNSFLVCFNLGPTLELWPPFFLC